MAADRERASERRLAKRWRSERVSLIFSAFIRTNERETATSVRTVVLANAAAGRDERHRLATSAERRRNLGKDDRTMFDIVAMRQGKAAGWGAKVVGNEREGRAKGGAASGSRLDWRGGWGGWGHGERGTSGRAADGAAGWSASGSFSCLSAAAAAAVRKSAGLARGVGWVGARADAGLLAASRRGRWSVCVAGL
ncbi:hypothetical protein THAOC_11245, partial [Thalassiosira oceanica]